ncbi:MAG: VWA domain-containing protein [Myxococcota bacterium]|nr:VWA domain-containing protein [Myxococcota bacterium]
MSGIQFAQPEWAYALWAVAGFALILIVLELRSGRDLDRFLKPDMQNRLVRRLPPGRRFGSLGLLILALTAIVIALMRPQWGIEFIKTPQVGAEIMIALDVSRSMLAEDVAPNRLERAKAEIRDLLPYLEGDQVGLIAFAGRASVLSPLTPDFGFLRLVLDHVRVGSVTRGGTRLEEPIRKATEGFGSTGDLARVLLFFTDGEDHDSFPLDAAKQAAERGIRIVIIGFGDEAGSEMWVTDPLSGARTRIVDAEGRPAVSRLDGDLLRELALATEGAYVPAGTGVLDLRSIFDAHLRPLMRGEGEAAGHTVQKEGFGWALLLAWLALLGHGLLAQPRFRQAGQLALLLLLFLPTPDAHAQDGPSAPEPMESMESAEAFSEQSATAPFEVPEDPREAYNRGVDALAEGELDDAERLFEGARQRARGDGTLRFQATYNQSWVEVERAEEKLQEDPAAALQDLERAADWLREAIALRPENKTARVNLEILLQRILLLSDALAAQNPPEIAQRLDALIESQRTVTRDIRAVAGQFQEKPELDADEATRARFRGVAVAERQVLTEAGQLAQTIGEELSSLQKKPQAERTPEEAMQIASLEAVLHYLHRGRERIGQSRVQLRRRQASRAHRRATTGLFELKRAREQLLGPVELIDGLIRDNRELAEESALLLSGTVALNSPSKEPSWSRPVIPTWLDSAYLEEAARSLAERTSELNAKLSAGVGQSQDVTDPAQQKAIQTLEAAQPHVELAAGKLADSADALGRDETEQALKDEFSTLKALAEAREQFLDLKGLIETAWADESRIHAVLEKEEADALAELALALAELQKRNLERAERMGRLIEEQSEQLAAPPSSPDPLSEEELSAQKEKLELANGILALVESAMRGAEESLSQLGQQTPARTKAIDRTAQAIRGLEGLRRLFFSILEHLKDVAQLQAELGDETEEIAGRGADAEWLGPLEKHQQALAERSEELAEILHEQSFAQPEELVGQQAAQDPAAAEEAAERLTQASEWVLMASQDMLAAADGLEVESPAEDPDAETPLPDLERIRGQQDAALDKLAKALAILQPPQPESQPEDQEENQDQEQQQESQSEGGQAQEQANPEETNTPQDPNQLLQSVRDREAERHRRKQKDEPSGYNPVEKDW